MKTLAERLKERAEDYPGTTGALLLEAAAALEAQPVAHSKSEYKRLKTLGVDVLPPEADARSELIEEISRLRGALLAIHDQPDGARESARAALDATGQPSADARDAARYRFCQQYGFPVRNQSPGTPDLRWTINGDYFGATPSLAIDAGIAARSKPAGGESR